MDIGNVIVAILSGLTVAIPLIIELIKYVKQSVQEKNWANLMSMVMKFMVEAEQRFETGTYKKKYVMDSIICAAASINYALDAESLAKIENMIDEIINITKEINVKDTSIK